ncbi:MAG: DUF1223 domain-containing protein [Bacteroidota bacterium]|nr:DUF1223 domain-containing protein [Bacteroidota bacterium]
MKKILHLLFVSLPLFTLSFYNSSSGMKDRKDSANHTSKGINLENKNVAVLELFTSQGCSSCPPADRLVETYTTKDNVIVLSFHVDYWNKLGWKDPYSSKQYTQRQYDYADVLHSNVYTPQLVINGQTEMIGSDAGKIDATLNKVFGTAPDALLSIKTATPEKGALNITFNVSGKIENALLNIALVEKKTTTQIKAGENGGATLSGNNVVRSFQTTGRVKEGDNNSSIDIPNGLDLKSCSVVLFLQQKGTHKIIAASQMSL